MIVIRNNYVNKRRVISGRISDIVFHSARFTVIVHLIQHHHEYSNTNFLLELMKNHN